MLLSWENVAIMEKNIGLKSMKLKVQWDQSSMVKIAVRISNVFSKRRIINC